MLARTPSRLACLACPQHRVSLRPPSRTLCIQKWRGGFFFCRPSTKAPPPLSPPTPFPATNNGNWRLGYVDSTGGTNEYIWSWSEILWPYQVRSFDAVRLPSKGYDIIELETDLPPITDYTVSGTKMVAVEQRVQGIVLFKFDYVNKTWSDHRLFDVSDNKKAIVRENVKLSRYVDGDEVFMTYAKEYGGGVGQAITKRLG